MNTMCHAITIHKSQDLIVPEIIVHIRPKELSLGVSYVAFSTVLILEDISIEVLFAKDGLTKF